MDNTTALIDPFELTETQKMIRDTVRDFSNEVLAPRAKEVDRVGEFSWDNFKKMAELGLTGIPISEEYGGAGADNLSYIIALEEIARSCGSTCLTLAAHISLGTMPIYDFGNEAQKKKFVPALAKGEVVGAYGLTEPGAGSDSGATATKAVKVDGGWRVNGSKLFMTNAGVASSYIITGVTDPEKPKHERISAFVLEKGWKGITIAKKEDKLGCRGSDTCLVTFDDVFVPDANLLGERGKGFSYFMKILDGGRIGIGAMALGLARGAYEKAVAYAKERKAFGVPIAQHQAIAFKLADMATDHAAARLLTLRAAAAKGEGRPFTHEASMAKLFASEAAQRAVGNAIQIHGGYGYTEDYPVERFFRDARVQTIYEGTSEIQRLVIAREMLHG